VLPLRQAWDVCSPIGTIVTVAINQRGNFSMPAAQWSNAAKSHRPGNMAGSNSKRDLPRYVRLIEVGLFDAKTLVTSTFPLDRVRDAFQAVADRTTVASIVVFT
jgi:Zn-dependent alcohol dehydrogenase